MSTESQLMTSTISVDIEDYPDKINQAVNIVRKTFLTGKTRNYDFRIA